MPFPDSVPELTDGVVRLRAHRDADADRIVEQCQDPDTLRWTTVPRPYGPAEAQGFLRVIQQAWDAEGGVEHWAICEVGDPDEAFLGTIDLRPKPGGTADIGFGLHPQARGRGLMARALRLVAARHFEDRDGHRLYWYADRGNFGSWRVAWACGFIHHGLLPGHNAGLASDPSLLAADAWVASIGPSDDRDRPVAPWREAVVLEGRGIRLRPWRDADEAAVEAGDSPEHFVPPGADPTPSTFADWLLRRRERMARGQSTHWCIADAASDRALGDVMIGELGAEDGSGELGYLLFPSARGRGAASIAAELVIGHAFTAEADGGRGLRRLTALTVGDNEPSAAVLERLGFTCWGTEPQFCRRADGSYDVARHWVLTAPERR